MSVEQTIDITSDDDLMCCSRTTTRSNAMFNVKIIFIFTILLYSMASLTFIEITGDSCNHSIPFHTGLIGSIMGLFIDHPRKINN